MTPSASVVEDAAAGAAAAARLYGCECAACACSGRRRRYGFTTPSHPAIGGVAGDVSQSTSPPRPYLMSCSLASSLITAIKVD